MKKLIPGLLSMLLCLGMATGCEVITDKLPDVSLPGFVNDLLGKDSNETSDSESDSASESTEAPLHAHEKDLKDVKEYLQGIVNEMSLETRKNFTVINSYSFFGEEAKYDIAWSVNVEGVTIQEGETEDTIVIGELAEDTPYVLTATITDPEGCHTVTADFEAVALKALSLVPTMITEKPVANTAYKLYVYQSTLAKDLYFTGYDKAATYYFGTTENYEEAVDVYAEYIDENNFNLTFTYEGVKKYIGVKLSDDGAHDNIVATTEPVSSFFWSEELQTVLTHLEVNKNGTASDYYLGNYSNKDTISASMTSYAGGSGNNVGGLVVMVDKSQFTPAVKVATEVEKLSVKTEFIGADTVELPTVGKTYSDVAISWAVTSGNVTIENNVLTIVAPTEDTTAVITATITCGDVTETKEITLTLKAGSGLPADGSTLTISEVLALVYDTDTTNKYYVTGTVTEVYNTQYGNMYITDETGATLTVYGTYSADGTLRFDAMDAAAQPKAGDTVTFYSILSSYNGKNQLKNAWIVNVVPGTGNEGGEEDEPTDPTPSEVVKATGDSFTIESYATANGWSDATLYATIEHENYTITTSGTPNGDWGLNTGKYYANGQNWRIYQNETPSIVFTAVEGKTIATVKITYAIKNTGILTFNGANYDSDAVITVNAATATFGVGQTADKTNGQVQITAIEVIFATEGGETPSPDTHEHSYGEGVVTAPTCTEKGYTTYTCACGNSYTDNEVAATGHNFVDGVCACGEITTTVQHITAAPVEGAIYTYHLWQSNLKKDQYFTGAMDGYYFATSNEATEAVELQVEYIDETTFNVFFMNASGAKQYIGVKINGTYKNVVFGDTAASSFKWNAEIATITTVASDGNEYYLGNYNTFKTFSASTISYATKAGNNVAGLVFVREVETPTPDPHEHNYSTVVTPPTCTEDGYTTYTCACGDSYTADEVAMVAHTYGEGVVTAPTCTAAGYTTYTCGACGDSYTDNEVAATGHSFAEGTCGVCGAPDPDYVAHVHAYEETVTQPTCTVDGYTTYTCACGDTYTGNVVTAPGHDYDEVVTAPTCTAAGYTEYICGICDDSYTVDGEAATGHNDNNSDYKCDGCSTKMLPAANEALTIAQAIAIGKLYTKDTYTTDKYYLTGVITEVQNETYGNVVISDGSNTILVYGLYDYNGANRYDKLSYKPVVGDEITVWGIIGYYSASQMKNGWIDEVIAHEHNYTSSVTAPTCTADGYTTHTCSICKGYYVDTVVEATGHTTEAGTCENCGQEIGGEVTEPSVVATFDFGANGSASHVDGNSIGSSKSYTVGSYTLALTSMANVYGPAYDAKGNSCIKLGASSKAGTLTFTVPANVTKVVIYAAKYKSNTSKYSINGGTVASLTKNSNDGAYDAIEIDTTTTKTITFATQSGGYRVMVNTIEFWGL